MEQRMVVALVVSFLAVLALGPSMIAALKNLKVTQFVHEDGPKSHKAKQGTPTMGGILMALPLFVFAMVFAYSDGRWTTMLMAVVFSAACCLLGAMDDYLSIRRRLSMGLSMGQKVVGQFVISLGIALYCYLNPAIGSGILIPFTDIVLDLGIFYVPFAMFVVIAMINSVNLLDGLDGLCTGVTLIVLGTFALICLFAVNSGVMDSAIGSNMAIFSAVGVGVCLGFLRFNSYPAGVFMGDAGSFVLGGMLSVIGLFTRLPLLLPIMGLMYVVSSLSDIIQLLSLKFRKKRVFRMAPLHHHFELGNIPETRIVACYMIVTFLLCLVALVSLK